VTPVSKLKVPLPNFVASRKDDEDGVKFLVRVESDAKVTMGNYTHSEHDACIARLHNEGQLNRVLELTGVAYGPRLVPGSDASIKASKKRKTDSIGRVLVKRSKAPENKKAETVKTSTLQGKISLKRPPDMEVASAKSIKLSKKIVPRAIAVVAAARGMLEASGPKSAAGTLSSKIIGGTSGSKPAAGAKKKSLRPSRNVMFPLLELWRGHLQKSIRSHHRIVK
jgi:hypothetical protein